MTAETQKKRASADPGIPEPSAGGCSLFLASFCRMIGRSPTDADRPAAVSRETSAAAECEISRCSRPPARACRSLGQCDFLYGNDSYAAGRLLRKQVMISRNAKDRRAAAAYSLPMRSFQQSTIFKLRKLSVISLQRSIPYRQRSCQSGCRR